MYITIPEGISYSRLSNETMTSQYRIHSHPIPYIFDLDAN